MSILNRILTEKRDEVLRLRREKRFAEIEEAARLAPPVREFSTALRETTGEGFGLICEIKRASPSRGLIRADFDPGEIAQAYEAGGATCLSVLTDRKFFQGSNEHLIAAKAATRLPVLRKDFVIDPYQVVESRSIGADCILVILAAVSDTLANELARTAQEWNMDVLFEVHDWRETERANALAPRLLGINNRDLNTFHVDLATTEKIALRTKSGSILVSESGITSRADLVRLSRCGVRAFLVGECLMRQADTCKATRALLDPQVADA